MIQLILHYNGLPLYEGTANLSEDTLHYQFLLKEDNEVDLLVWTENQEIIIDIVRYTDRGYGTFYDYLNPNIPVNEKGLLISIPVHSSEYFSIVIYSAQFLNLSNFQNDRFGNRVSGNVFLENYFGSLDHEAFVHYDSLIPLVVIDVDMNLVKIEPIALILGYIVLIIAVGIIAAILEGKFKLEKNEIVDQKDIMILILVLLTITIFSMSTAIPIAFISAIGTIISIFILLTINSYKLGSVLQKIDSRMSIIGLTISFQIILFSGMVILNNLYSSLLVFKINGMIFLWVDLALILLFLFSSFKNTGIVNENLHNKTRKIFFSNLIPFVISNILISITIFVLSSIL